MRLRFWRNLTFVFLVAAAVFASRPAAAAPWSCQWEDCENGEGCHSEAFGTAGCLASCSIMEDGCFFALEWCDFTACGSGASYFYCVEPNENPPTYFQCKCDSCEG